MNQMPLNARKRDRFGKQALKTLRREGKIPAVVYGHGQETLPLELDYREFESFMRKSHGESVLIALAIEDNAPKTAILQEVQKKPIQDTLLHADFREISMTERLTAEVHVVLVGRPVGAKEGGILEQTIRELTIECLPTEMPEHLEVDVTALDIGDSIYVRDLSFPNIDIITEGDVVVATVGAPRVEQEEEAPVEALEEPELIGRKGEEGEEENESS